MAISIRALMSSPSLRTTIIPSNRHSDSSIDLVHKRPKATTQPHSSFAEAAMRSSGLDSLLRMPEQQGAILGVDVPNKGVTTMAYRQMKALLVMQRTRSEHHTRNLKAGLSRSTQDQAEPVSQFIHTLWYDALSKKNQDENTNQVRAPEEAKNRLLSLHDQFGTRIDAMAVIQWVLAKAYDETMAQLHVEAGLMDATHRSKKQKRETIAEIKALFEALELVDGPSLRRRDATAKKGWRSLTDQEKAWVAMAQGWILIPQQVALFDPEFQTRALKAFEQGMRDMERSLNTVMDEHRHRQSLTRRSAGRTGLGYHQPLAPSIRWPIKGLNSRNLRALRERIVAMSDQDSMRSSTLKTPPSENPQAKTLSAEAGIVSNQEAIHAYEQALDSYKGALGSHLDKLIAAIEQEADVEGEDAKMLQLRLQEVVQKSQQLMEMRSHLLKSVHEVFRATVQNI